MKPGERAFMALSPFEKERCLRIWKISPSASRVPVNQVTDRNSRRCECENSPRRFPETVVTPGALCGFLETLVF
jgi:hypothetical protein